TSKCVGLITGGSGTCPSTWTISAGTSYNLYIPSGSAIPSATATASCGTTACTNPSSYTNEYDCSAGGCQWCSFGGGACKDLSYSCPTTGGTVDNCIAQTSQSACNAQSGDSFSFDCGWCPNSYSGGTSANGGTCMKAENLAGSCGGLN
ncbi:MAG: hypothetical protein WA139_03310, partial [Candidatus Aenigmatarchaeota archaeon]